MNLRTFVKVGSITNLSDARFCAGFGVNLLGFDLNPDSDNYISIDQANEIMGWVAGPEFVAELGEMALADIITLQKENNFPYIQTNLFEIAKELSVQNIQVILNLNIAKRDDIIKIKEAIESGLALNHIIISCSAPELIPDIDSELKNNTTYSILKGYDVEISQLDHIIQVQPFSGIELKGSQEEKPGFKEYDELADILEALELED